MSAKRRKRHGPGEIVRKLRDADAVLSAECWGGPGGGVAGAGSAGCERTKFAAIFADQAGPGRGSTRLDDSMRPPTLLAVKVNTRCVQRGWPSSHPLPTPEIT